MTSAPRSASTVAANGAAIRVPRSRTRSPTSGPERGKVMPERVASGARTVKDARLSGELVGTDRRVVEAGENDVRRRRRRDVAVGALPLARVVPEAAGARLRVSEVPGV